ncbi:hypothetical protein Leryth_019432 [Lithospermum erythrorhizon]|nr:hypothetical protein Leryth_019432 [Lithospermum erythrorhizon]
MVSWYTSDNILTLQDSLRFEPKYRMCKEAFPKSDVITFDIKGTWKAMESCYQLGLAKSIGVSNYSWKKLSQVLEIATIPPSVNQVEVSVTWQQKELIEFCKEKNIHVMAWSPLGSYNTFYGSAAVLESPVLKSIAANKQKTSVALRWIYEQGATSIPKSFNKERMKQNLKISDWELTEEEIAQIHQIPQKRGYAIDMFINPDGQYKTLEELWDEE